jgi:hypothetical protein
MAADHFMATPAFPRLFLAIKELFNPVLFEEIQVLYHAHPVARAVSSSQPIAWKATALKTKSDLVICQFGTIFFSEKHIFCFLVCSPCSKAF